MKRPSPGEMVCLKENLYRDLARGVIDIREASRRMRRILGMSQKDYARKVAGIAPRILAELENGSGNHTLATLEKIATPVVLQVTFLPPPSQIKETYWQAQGCAGDPIVRRAPDETDWPL